MNIKLRAFFATYTITQQMTLNEAHGQIGTKGSNRSTLVTALIPSGEQIDLCKKIESFL